MQCCYVKNIQDFKIMKINQCHSYELSDHTSFGKEKFLKNLLQSVVITYVGAQRVSCQKMNS